MNVVEEIKRLIPGEEYRRGEGRTCSDVFCKDVVLTRRSVYYHHSGYDSPLLRKTGNDEYIVRDVIHAGWLGRGNRIDKSVAEEVDEFAVFLAFTVADVNNIQISYLYQIPEDYTLDKVGIIRGKRYGDEDEWYFEDAHIVERIVERPMLMYILYASLERKRKVGYRGWMITHIDSQANWKEVHEYVVIIDSGTMDREVAEKWAEYSITTSQLLKGVYSRVYGEECGSGRKVVYPDDSSVFCHLPLPYILRRTVTELDKYGRDIALTYALVYSLPFLTNVTSKPRDAISSYILSKGDPVHLHYDDGTTLELRELAVMRSSLRDIILTARITFVLENLLTVVIPTFDVNYSDDNRWC